MKTVKGHSVRGLCGLKPLQPEGNVYKVLKCRQKAVVHMEVAPHSDKVATRQR